MIESSLSYKLNYREVASALFCQEILLEIAISVRFVEANNCFFTYSCVFSINLSVFLSANAQAQHWIQGEPVSHRKKGRIKISYFDLGEILRTLHTYPATTAGTSHIFKLNDFFKVFYGACVTFVSIFYPFVMHLTRHILSWSSFLIFSGFA